MNHTIQLTAEQFKALQSGQPITIKPPKPAIQIARWEPIGGEFSISNSFSVLRIKTEDEVKKSGMKYKTKDQADSAAKAIRAYARQLAWLAENDDGWVADWSNNRQIKFYVYYHHETEKALKSYDASAESFGLVYMSQDNATKLAELMNDGIVEF